MPIEIKILIIGWVVMINIICVDHWFICPGILDTPLVREILCVLARVLIFIATPAILVYTVVSF